MEDLAVCKGIAAVDSCSYCVDLEFDPDLDEMRGAGYLPAIVPDLCSTNARIREGSHTEPLA